MSGPAAVAAVERRASNRSAGATAPAGRLLNLLENESKERILRLLTAFQMMTVLEQEAFAQEMNAYLSRDDEQQGGVGNYVLKGPALEVRMRDRSYVALATSPTHGSKAITDHTDTTSTTTATTIRDEGEREKLTELVKSQLSGEPLVAFPSTQSGDIDTSIEDVKSRPHATTYEEASDNQSGKGPTTKKQEVMRTESPTDENVSTTCSQEQQQQQQQVPPVLYRSRGYQALRLARDDKLSVEDTYTRPTVLNLTGMPIEESDVWEWFECMDVTGSGTVGVVPFLTAINELERDFGVSQRAKAEFVEEVEALATDGLLTFEKFAYLVSRFPRQ
ncbi:uncharacterized protein TM35_000092320 [Trypanosoma theileri]|uniref:EF-hand domain-containing protein n=1 Tax=Trypanosoma theileri TaxID=67003 RepID=A0A1X0NZT2_9TRYP|nr:uncharacterized protein TM35_000092320 [Trypanosoma theileri]ORC90182.1 hypothetical protein TM35_000092320 [Trypanosoma theileri]